MKKILYISAMAVVLAACGDNSGKTNNDSGNTDNTTNTENKTEPVDPAVIENPKTADDPQGTNGEMPVLAFEKETYEFPQHIKEGESVSYSFKFTNTGKGDLIISDATAPCGCTIPSFSKEPIAPGGEGKIDVRYNSEGKGTGRHEKAITVTSNSIPNPRILRIVVHVDPKQ